MSLRCFDEHVVDGILESASAKGELFFDIEASSVTVHDAEWRLWGIGISDGSVAVYVPVEAPFCEKVARAIWNFKGDVVGHNPKFDMQGIKKQFRLTDYPKKPVCTLIALNLIDENIPPNQVGLKPTIERLFKIKMMTYDEAIVFGKDSEEFAAYCCDDCLKDALLWKWEKVRMEEEGVHSLFRNVHMRALKTVCDLESYGFGWDIETARELIENYNAVAMELEDSIRFELGNDINLNSPDQLAKTLFSSRADGGMGIPTKGVALTKTGKRHVVDEKVFEALAPRYPIMRLLRDWKFATGMIGKYIWKISEYAMADEHSRTHPETWLTSTTGRTRMQNPPNQTIPKYPPKRFCLEGKATFSPDFEIRRGFRARPGYRFLVADLAGAQLRFMAHVSQDPVMVNAYLSWKCTACHSEGKSKTLLLACPKCGAPANEKILKDESIKGFWHGADLHQKTFEEVNKVAGRVVLGDRQDGKTCNFALIFGATGWKMNQEYPKYSVKEWDSIIDAYFGVYQGVKKFHMRMEHLMDETGVVNDIFGRKRHLTKREIESSRKHALNMFINFPIQASEVHYALLSMAKYRERLIEAGIYNDGRFDIHGVGIPHFMHDEIVSESPEEYLKQAESLLMDTMRFAVQLSIPMDAECKIKVTW